MTTTEKKQTKSTRRRYAPKSIAKQPQTYADHLAEFISNAMFEAHRGAMWLPGHERKIILAFGNDGFKNNTAGDGDDRSQREVQYLHDALLKTAGAPQETDFGTSSDQYTWAMLLQVTPDVAPDASLRWVNATVWAGWEFAHCGEVATWAISDAPDCFDDSSFWKEKARDVIETVGRVLIPWSEVPPIIDLSDQEAMTRFLATTRPEHKRDKQAPRREGSRIKKR